MEETNMSTKYLLLSKTEKKDIDLLITNYCWWHHNNGPAHNETVRYLGHIKNLMADMTLETLDDMATKLSQDKKIPRDLVHGAEYVLANLLEKAETSITKAQAKNDYTDIVIRADNSVKLLNTSVNTETCMRRNNVSIKYNELIKTIEIDIPGVDWYSQTKNTDAMVKITDMCRRDDLAVTDIDKHVISIAGRNAYHPVRDWFEQLAWDGTDRIDEILSTIEFRSDMDMDLIKSLFVKWLKMGVEAAMNKNGYSPQGVFTLVGEQGLSKTRWIKSIIPNNDWVMTDLQINPHDKDDVIKFVKNWCVELGELDSTFKKSDMAALKSFITRDYDQFRAPYGKIEENYPRQTFFYATVNNEEFLIDDQNRRFWAFAVTRVNADHNVNIEQLWAQAKHMWSEDRTYWLSKNELDKLNQHNEQFSTQHPAVARVLTQGIFNPMHNGQLKKQAKGRDVLKLNATGILLHCGMNNPTRGDIYNLGLWLRKNKFEWADKRVKSYMVCFLSDADLKLLEHEATMKTDDRSRIEKLLEETLH